MFFVLGDFLVEGFFEVVLYVLVLGLFGFGLGFCCG